jgi:hypothetical protein
MPNAEKIVLPHLGPFLNLFQLSRRLSMLQLINKKPVLKHEMTPVFSIGKES